MTISEIVYGLMLVLLVMAYADVLASIKGLKRKQEKMQEEHNRCWREHKDDHFAVVRYHKKLVDALGMKEVPAAPSHYVKEQQ